MRSSLECSSVLSLSGTQAMAEAAAFQSIQLDALSSHPVRSSEHLSHDQQRSGTLQRFKKGHSQFSLAAAGMERW